MNDLRIALRLGRKWHGEKQGSYYDIEHPNYQHCDHACRAVSVPHVTGRPNVNWLKKCLKFWADDLNWKLSQGNLSRTAVPAQNIEHAILILRGHKVLLDAELSTFNGVTTKRLNEQVKRNRERFPVDIMFRLTAAELERLNQSQIATGSQRHRDHIARLK
ncbi:MAG: ORF6N domain-containing protein [Betaproteobacteria bacterium]|nr:ORF6N domain-containing protein [Betaproteobacteria bacterium]